MVKEFQQLRKQITQTLRKEQAQRVEIETLIAKNEQEKKDLFLDIISIIEALEKKEAIAVKDLKSTQSAKDSLPEIFNNLKNDLTELLTKHNVHPIPSRKIIDLSGHDNESDLTPGNKIKYSKVKYLYHGNILND